MRYYCIVVAIGALAGCATDAPRQSPAQGDRFVLATPGARVAGSVVIESAKLTPETGRVAYALKLTNTSDQTVRLKIRLRFFDDLENEYVKGPDRWTSHAIAGGAAAEVTGVFTMPEPTRLGVTAVLE